MSADEDPLDARNQTATGVGVQVIRIRHVVPGALEPANEMGLPLEELPDPDSAVWTIERDLDRAPVTGDGVGAVAVVWVEALARAAVIGIVVVRLIGCDALLVEERRRTPVANHEDRVVLVALRVN